MPDCFLRRDRKCIDWDGKGDGKIWKDRRRETISRIYIWKETLNKRKNDIYILKCLLSNNIRRNFLACSWYIYSNTNIYEIITSFYGMVYNGIKCNKVWYIKLSPDKLFTLSTVIVLYDMLITGS